MIKRVRADRRFSGFLLAAASAIPLLAAPAIAIAESGWCDFDVTVQFIGNDHNHWRDFVDHDGNYMKSIFAGPGNTFIFTNPLTGATISKKSIGFMERYEPIGDGLLGELHGTNVMNWWPTDYPAGPLTYIYTGRLVFVLDFTGPVPTGTLQSFTGRVVDVCAALSG